MNNLINTSMAMTGNSRLYWMMSLACFINISLGIIIAIITSSTSSSLSVTLWLAGGISAFNLLLYLVFRTDTRQLNTMIYTDDLTGLYNYRAFKQISSTMSEYKLLILDIDYFKKINDTYGHSLGDEALTTFADIIKSNLSAQDLAFRYGGEEFIILMPAATPSHCLAWAEHVRKQVESYVFVLDRQPVRLTISIGIAIKCCNTDHREVFAEADQALYCAKQTGRNKIKLSDQIVGFATGSNLATSNLRQIIR